MRQLNSANFSSRDNAGISLLVLHYTGMQSAEAAISRLCLPQAKVSAHYVVDEDGTLCQLVDEKDSAWHAGLSYWRGHQNVNDISIGIEIVNPGHEWGYRVFPGTQMEALAKLCAGVLARHAIPACNVVAHSDIAPERKDDPGELFNWQWLAQKGVGLWPQDRGQGAGGGGAQPLKLGNAGEAVRRMQADLAQYGYRIPQSGMFDEATRKVAVAFQRHFRQSDIGGVWDNECQRLLATLLALSKMD